MKTHSLIPSLSLLVIPALSSPAWAEESPKPASDAPASADEGERPKMNLSVAPPTEPLQRTQYVHEGFYFRVNVGAGFLYTALNDKVLDVSNDSTTFALGTDILVGGSPSPGFVFGGGVLSDLGFTSNFGGNSGGPAMQFLVGPFFDAFPNDKDGWHLGTMVGGVAAAVSESPSTPLFGGGAAAWAGYDLWVAPEWSTGFKLRAAGTHAVAEDASVTNFSAQLLISILSH
jgi:hypothetical protein